MGVGEETLTPAKESAVNRNTTAAIRREFKISTPENEFKNEYWLRAPDKLTFNEVQTTGASTLEICEVGPNSASAFALEVQGESPRNGITRVD